ncbi:HNH endonuclease [uncultured Desulfuromonas sp.]|jgi:5-methylcytosine-specific restriction endonuclease McrA|uniref:HNH endonuclease n=1 Tax=uncultured Desulfuromonas sp. TaxID=181013 RepID=UPI002AAA7980|nr:HNH endonuclease [uncultured Desulfuromonas sp.]
MVKKRFFREPIPEIFDAARYLDAAVSAHLNGQPDIADKLFELANDRKVWEWTDSVWGKNSPYVIVNKQPRLHTAPKVEARMPTTEQKNELHKRDGYHCRFCGIPVIRAEIRKIIHKAYPNSVPWGRTNASQHAAFQCMWLQYDHVVPHSNGGTNDLDNLVITCAACNFGKMEYALEELGLLDPREFAPIQSQWDGLERISQT